MSAEEPAISFRVLLGYTDYLANRWINYFKEQPEALDVNVGGKTGAVRNLVSHIFQAEQFFAARLFREAAPPPQKMDSPTLADLESLHREAQQKLIRYVASASDEELARVQAFGPVKVSNRKILTQAALHGVHHWAQVAMEVRQAGFPEQKPQDIIISEVMQ